MSARTMGSQSRAKRRNRLIRRHGTKCHWCGCQMRADLKPPEPRAMTLEHLVPISLGGSDNLGNLRLACHECNRRRGDSLAGWATALPGGGK